MESKDYSWKWVTADECLCKRKCELIYANLVPSTAATCTATLYNGVDTSGEVINAFRTAESKHSDFAPPVPVLCRGGLFVDCITVVKGMFVMWRVLPD